MTGLTGLSQAQCRYRTQKLVQARFGSGTSMERAATADRVPPVAGNPEEDRFAQARAGFLDGPEEHLLCTQGKEFAH